jgi:hypothetical protein
MTGIAIPRPSLVFAYLITLTHVREIYNNLRIDLKKRDKGAEIILLPLYLTYFSTTASTGQTSMQVPHSVHSP